jgi:hypothetical protein
LFLKFCSDRVRTEQNWGSEKMGGVGGGRREEVRYGGRCENSDEEVEGGELLVRGGERE